MPSPPNVLVVYLDDVGIGDIGASGFATTLVTTPHMDRLASEGVRFTRFYSGAALCAPSRYSVLTGNLVQRGEYFAGAWGLGRKLQVRAGQWTTGHLFRAAGYATAFVGKSHMGGELRAMVELEGVTHALVAFVASIGVSNIVSTFLAHTLHKLGA